MPRGVKKTVDFNVEIEKIDEKISMLNEEIKKLKKSRVLLVKKAQESDMKKVHEFISKSGLSANEILAKLEK